MLVVTIDLYPFGQGPPHSENLRTVVIANDGTGTLEHGNYDVWDLGPDGDPGVRSLRRDADARIDHFPRNNGQTHTTDLVGRALCALAEQVVA